MKKIYRRIGRLEYHSSYDSRLGVLKVIALVSAAQQSSPLRFLFDDVLDTVLVCGTVGPFDIIRWSGVILCLFETRNICCVLWEFLLAGIF